MNSIDFSRSRAILVGTAHYTHGLDEMRAAHNSLVTMRELLVGPLCGWPLNRVTVFEDKTTRDGLNQQIAELIHDTTDVLLLYYVGHGQLLDGEHLGLALVDTHEKPSMRHSTSLRLNDLRTELKYGCNARVKLVILDCCFSGIGTRNTQGPGLADQVRMATKVEGAYTLTASRASQKAVYQRDETGLTYFTKIFDEVVRDGIPGAGAKLTLKDIHKEVAARFLRLNLPDGQLRPEPSVLAVDTAEELALARNVRAAQPAPPAPPQPVRPSKEPARAPRRVVASHMGGVVVAAGCFIAANFLPVGSGYWTDKSSGLQRAQVTDTFNLAHPWARQIATGPDAAKVEVSQSLAPLLGLGTAAMLALAVLFPLLLRSGDPSLKAKTAYKLSLIWVSCLAYALLVTGASATNVIKMSEAGLDVRAVAQSGAWMLFAASVMVAETLRRTGKRLGQPMTRFSPEHWRFKLTNQCPKCHKFTFRPTTSTPDGTRILMWSAWRKNQPRMTCSRCGQSWNIYVIS